MRNLSPFTMIIAKNYTEREVTDTAASVVIALEHELGNEIEQFLEDVS
jgi:hypothetical protein